ncbi:MAG: TcpQ domain-containing protein [Janthinobacterium lividum]
MLNSVRGMRPFPPIPLRFVLALALLGSAAAAAATSDRGANAHEETVARETASAVEPAVETAIEPDVTLILRPGGARLSTALAEFARDHDWELAWEIERDFPIDHAARFDGPFLDIIAAVVGSLRKTDAPVRARIYRANKVVRIVHATR